MTGAVSRERTRNYLRQIRGAVVYRVVAIAASFVAIHLMIQYPGQRQLCVWTNLLTIMSRGRHWPAQQSCRIASSRRRERRGQLLALFGIRAHIGVDAESSLTHTIVTALNYVK